MKYVFAALLLLLHAATAHQQIFEEHWFQTATDGAQNQRGCMAIDIGYRFLEENVKEQFRQTIARFSEEKYASIQQWTTYTKAEFGGRKFFLKAVETMRVEETEKGLRFVQPILMRSIEDEDLIEFKDQLALEVRVAMTEVKKRGRDIFVPWFEFIFQDLAISDFPACQDEGDDPHCPAIQSLRRDFV